jgi:hypothetical protein
MHQASRKRGGRNVCTSFLIVDAQSVKNTDTAKHKGYQLTEAVPSQPIYTLKNATLGARHDEQQQMSSR